MNSKILGLLAVGLLVGPMAANAVTFGFAADPNRFITSYQGFNWSGGYGNESWVNGTVNHLWGAPSAPLGYAWSNSATNLSMTLGSPGAFTFDSVALYGDSSRWGGYVGSATIEGWLGGNLVYTFVSPVLNGLPRDTFTTFTLNWVNVDSVRFSTVQNLLLTDITIISVPEPGTLALLGLGLAGLGLSRRRTAN